MEAILSVLIQAVLVIALIFVPYHFLNTLWLTPKKLEKCLRDQGFQGNPYRPINGDLSEITNQAKSAVSKKPPILSSSSLSHDYFPRILPFIHQTIQRYGMESFMWYGRRPRVNITKPEVIREIFSNYQVYRKQSHGQKSKFGLVLRDSEDWVKVRRILNPAFHLDKLKKMLPTMEFCCGIMIQKWEDILVASGGSAEVDVYSSMNTLFGDVIARTAFGTFYEEAKKLFILQEEDMKIAFQTQRTIYFYIPGGRYLPTKINKMRNTLAREIREILKNLVKERKISKERGDNKYSDDLLSIMLESNEKEIEEHGIGLPIAEVINECRLFFVAGQDTTAALLTWTLLLLSQHQDWQNKVREEILLHFGKHTNPNYEALHSLKIVNMILNESLRLYPPVTTLTRTIHKNTRLKEQTLLHEMELNLAPIVMHRDPQLWGEDADKFNPSRFSEGISNAAKVPGSFIPFGGGPRVCIGQNFALIEAKLALIKILQRFTFELSPSYVHAPICLAALVPQFGVPLILHKI